MKVEIVHVIVATAVLMTSLLCHTHDEKVHGSGLKIAFFIFFTSIITGAIVGLSSYLMSLIFTAIEGGL